MFSPRIFPDGLIFAHAFGDLLIGGMTVVVTLVPVPIPLGDNSVAAAIMVMTRLTGHRVKRANGQTATNLRPGVNLW